MRGTWVVWWKRFAAAACMLAVSSVGAAVGADAGVELTTELVTVSAPADEQPRAGRMLLEPDRVRLEMDAKSAKAADARRVMIYRGDRDLVWSLDDKRRSYTEIDGPTMRRMRAQMRASLEKMPPEQRGPMEALLAASEAMQRERPTVTPTGHTDTVGGLACREVAVSRGGKAQSEICIADWQAAGVSKADLSAIGKLGKFQSEVFAAGRGAQGDDVLALFDELDGFPVRLRSLRAGQPRTELRILKIARKPIDAKVFEVPDGYKKHTFAGGSVPPAQ